MSWLGELVLLLISAGGPSGTVDHIVVHPFSLRQNGLATRD